MIEAQLCEEHRANVRIMLLRLFINSLEVTRNLQNGTCLFKDKIWAE